MVEYDLKQAITDAVEMAHERGKTCAVRRGKSRYMDEYGPYDPSPNVLSVEPSMTVDEALSLAKQYGWI